MSEAGPSKGRERNYQFTKNRLGGKWLLHAGHAYVLFRQNKNSSSVWTCSNKRKLKCGGAVKLNAESDFVKIQSNHIPQCVPDFFKNDVRVTVNQLSEEVGINYRPVQQIYEKKMATLKQKGPSAEIPAFRSLKSSLYRSRNNELEVQKTSFRKPVDVVIPEKFKANILVDYIEENNRIIVFVSPKGRTGLKHVTDYLCDGTFDCCPVPFKQIYTIHGDISETNNEDETNIVPIFYVLLVDKSTSTYITMFKKIKECLSDFNPKKFILDFEAATMSAIEHVFPDAVIHGCFVHFQRSVYRKAKSLGLLDHEETSSYVRMCICLAFLPQHEIEDGWLAMMENSLPAEPVIKFNDYFVEQWLEPAGMIAKWCCYKEQHRSTNLVEAWNNRLQCHLGSNPTLLLFLQMIMTDIATYDTAQDKLRFKGEPITKKKRQSICNEKYIAKLTKKYEEGHTAIRNFLENLCEIVLLTPKKKN